MSSLSLYINISHDHDNICLSSTICPSCAKYCSICSNYKSIDNLTLVTHITHTRTYTNAALYILGTEYCKAGASVNKGLSDLLERVGQQSGLFGPSPTPTSTPSAPSASHPSAGDHFYNLSHLHFLPPLSLPFTPSPCISLTSAIACCHEC
jgi:hypothetical protein